MENKLEQLSKSLVERGWKPNGLEKNDIQDISYDKDRKEISIQYIKWCTPSKFDLVTLSLSLRELVSKESGLWQFVCENEMIYSTPDDRGGPNYNWLENLFNCGWKHPDYWLMESALCDEYKLGDFLLNNIKIEG